MKAKPAVLFGMGKTSLPSNLRRGTTPQYFTLGETIMKSEKLLKSNPF